MFAAQLIDMRNPIQCAFESLAIKSPVAVYARGIRILIGALLVNAMASVVGLPNWYEFVQMPGAFVRADYMMYLFVVYPFLLGLIP